MFEKLVHNNRLMDHLEKSDSFSDVQYGFRYSQSNTDDRTAKASNRSGATEVVVLDTSKAFNRVLHAGLLHKRKSNRI